MAYLKKNLEDFGDGMQYRFVKHLIEHPESFVEVGPYIDPKVFQDEGLISIVSVMKDFFDKKGRTPSYFDLEYHLKDIIKEQAKLDKTYTAFRKIKDEKEFCDGLETAGEIGIKYVKLNDTLKQLENANMHRRGLKGFSRVSRTSRVRLMLHTLHRLPSSMNS